MTLRRRALPVRMLVEQNQPQDVRYKAEASNYADQLSVLHLLRLHKPLDGLQENRDAQGDEEDPINQRTKCLSALPLHSATIESEQVHGGKERAAGLTP